MMSEDSDALICDFAETYHVYDIWSLPLRTVATLASGLRDNSRIRQKLNGGRPGQDTVLLAGILDRLSVLVWMKTKDGYKGRNRPDSIVDILLKGDEPKEEFVGFDTGEEFDRAWAKLTGR